MIFNQYPYLNLNDLNLDYILSQIKVMMNEVTNFVSINAIKYADPIQWNITSQYEKNTIVIDPVTGTAYISVAPVPAGVALTRTEYWTVVFDLGSFVTRAAQNFTSRWESDTTTTATFPTNAGEWLVWGDVLYKALSNIIAGDTYVVGSNIEHFTIEDLYNEVVNDFNLAILNIRGSIGVNELDSSTATQNFDAGVLVWVWGQLYMTLTPINAGDTFLIGTNITAVRVDSFVNNRVNNAENRLRGSIGVNELDSAVATQNFNAGVLVWVDGQLYMTIAPINAGDSFDIGTNITAVRVDSYVLDRISTNEIVLRNYIDAQDATLAANIANTAKATFKKVRTNSRNFAERVALFVGDSYGDPNVIGATCFPDYVGAWLGFSEFHNLCVSGAGFYSPTPSLKYIQQLIDYAGDRDAVTDIFVICGLNDSKATTPTDPFYTSTVAEMTAFSSYVLANYPNAQIFYGYIGNMRDSYVLGIDPTDPRTYLARKCAMQILYENANYLGWEILPYCECILAQYDGYIGADGIHPTSDGEIELARGITKALRNGNALSYIYDYPCVTAFGMTINSGDMLYTLNNHQATFRLNGIQLNAANMTIGQNFTPLYFTRNWFNAPVCASAYIRLYDTQIGDVVLPAQFVFNENIMRIDSLGIFNDGTQTTYVNSFTFGSNGFIEIPTMTITCDATMLA